MKEQLKSLQLADDADAIQSIATESCFNVQTTEPLNDLQTSQLQWLLAETFESEKLRLETSIFQTSDTDTGNNPASVIDLEYGPRMTFASAFSSNAVSICQACGLATIDRLEKSRRFRITLTNTSGLSPRALSAMHDILHDRMTEQEYKEPISTFDIDVVTEQVTTVPIMEEGRAALEKINKEKGLGFDDFDLDYYTNLFKVSIVVVVNIMIIIIPTLTPLSIIIIIIIITGKIETQPYRCRVLRHGTIQLGTLAPLVLWRENGH